MRLGKVCWVSRADCHAMHHAVESKRIAACRALLYCRVAKIGSEDDLEAYSNRLSSSISPDDISKFEIIQLELARRQRYRGQSGYESYFGHVLPIEESSGV